MMVSEADLKTVILNDDQCFLMYFIMGNYFGPDIKGETSQKSILQRVAEGLPPYTLNQLTSSFLKVVELERVYYSILQNADKSLTVELPSLHCFFQGQAQCVHADYPQFPDLFPPQFHPQSQIRNPNPFKIIHKLVFINNPDTSYIKPDEVERFKRLSGVQDLHVHRDAPRLQLPCFGGDDVVCDTTNMLSGGKAEPNGNKSLSYTSSQKPRSSDDDDSLQCVDVVAPVSNGGNVMCRYMASENESDSDKVGPAMLFFPSRPSKKEWSEIVGATKSGFALTGSAAMGQVGPIIGLMDIGECEDSFLFRVSLPGVKRDETEFSCEVDIDGKVLISGVTKTGEETVSRYSQVFEMQTHNLCPPGHFTITFQLPGPVDPHKFSGNFGTDGILEGIVMKGKCT
ncbi:increased DNA methylation 2 [Abrus precatorius]|uniref:Increased DNA methylation 2 n=1 Tax=Abrus precatorius TaxID=3816 RepID=A0A8B8MI12_ABRPR|nr:increased DNA methylation 2 [Abrus precatorius]